MHYRKQAFALTLFTGLTLSSTASATTGVYKLTDVIFSPEDLSKYFPAQDTGIAIATVNIGSSVGNTISSRLSGLHGETRGINTGDALSTKNVWLQIFGNITTQENKGNTYGYQSNMAGVTVGGDADVGDGMTVGGALSYAQSTIDSKSSTGPSTDATSYMLTLYGDKDLPDGYYLSGQLGVGLNQYDTSRNAGATTADYNGLQYIARLDAGRDITLNTKTILTPLTSIQYTHLQANNYHESGPSALDVKSSGYDTAEIGFGSKIGWNIPWSGMTFNPSLRAKYLFSVGDKSLMTTSRFVIGGNSFTTQGIEADTQSLNLGTGLRILDSEARELSFDYDADLRKSLVGHTFQLKVRIPF